MASSSDISSAVLSKDSSSTPSSHRRFTQDQTSTLEKFYAEKQQASVEEKKDLVEATGLSHQQIRKWFENKRRTERRQRLKASGNAVKAIQNIEIEHVQESSTPQPSNVSEIKGLPAITPEVMETFKLLLADSITSVLQQLANQTTTSLQSLNVGVQTSNSGLIEHFPVPEGAFKDMSKGFDVDPELLDAAINDALVAEIQKPTKEMSIEFEPKRGKFSHQQLERLQKSFEVILSYRQPASGSSIQAFRGVGFDQQTGDEMVPEPTSREAQG
ncbi:hypothetical protein L596_029061 [Steinernema carpocapsae]|uniref:Homeobox domain-containing protein n=1 Tax=Steinernema carpocapsae TaxID=34508 RepID=A0A4U5LTI7_STECR|nr:hypothetical protein L596_029061 [Steinernema carpocapsae]